MRKSKRVDGVHGRVLEGGAPSAPQWGGWREFHGDPSRPAATCGVRLRDGWPPIDVFVSGEWMAYRQFAPVASQTTVRFGLTMASRS